MNRLTTFFTTDLSSQAIHETGGVTNLLQLAFINANIVSPFLFTIKYI